MNEIHDIPKDWKCLILKKLITQDIKNGYSPNCPEEPNGSWILSLGNLTENGFDPSQVKPAPKDDMRVQDFLLEPGDFLISRSNTLDKVGRTMLFRGEIENCSYPDLLMKFRVDETQVTNEYLEEYLRSSIVRTYIQRCASGTSGSMVKINKTAVEKIPVVLPTLPEQKAIADLLSTWDEAIEKTERLIQVKERRFKRMLNDLIHQGRSNHTWKGFNLSDLCVPVSRKNTENNTNVLTSSALNGLVSQIEYYNKSVSAEDVTGYYLLKKGEFAYNRSSAKGYPYGATKRLDRYEKGVLSTLYLCFALKPDAPCESDFLLHLFESGVANRELRAVCQEGARSHGLLNITKGDFFGIKLFLPSQEQQKKIQSALNTSQYEIDLLKRLADQYKTQKRGLMQRVLTGIWRMAPDAVMRYE